MVSCSWPTTWLIAQFLSFPEISNYCLENCITNLFSAACCISVIKALPLDFPGRFPTTLEASS